jgi:hypothetical protein
MSDSCSVVQSRVPWKAVVAFPHRKYYDLAKVKSQVLIQPGFESWFYHL